eukprot:12917343-Prorocentrum_lima.AAC.1
MCIRDRYRSNQVTAVEVAESLQETYFQAKAAGVASQTVTHVRDVFLSTVEQTLMQSTQPLPLLNMYDAV